MNYYTDFTSRLPKIQQEYIEKYVVEKSAKGALTKEQIDDIRNSEWGQNIKPIAPSYVNHATYGGSMGDVQYDSLMDAVMIDLNTIFAYSSVLDENLSGIEDNMKNFVKSVNVTIDSIERSLTEYRALLGDVEGYNAAHTQNFTNVNGGRLIGADAKGGYLSISPSKQEKYNSRSDISNVAVSKYPAESHLSNGGVYYASPPQNSVVKDYNEIGGTGTMLKGGTTGPGYWVEIMLVDNTADNKVSSSVNNKIYEGLTVVLTIYFTGSIAINEIDLDPISKYLVYVREIRYLPYSTGAWTPITYTDKDGNTINLSGEGYGSLSFKFDKLSAYGIELTMNVIDYDVVRFLVDSGTLFRSEMWEEIIDGKYSAMSEKSSKKGVMSASSKEDTNRLYDKVRIANSNDYSLYRSDFGKDETVKDWVITKNASEASISDKMAMTEINMKEYILGLYSIAPSNTIYMPSGVYYSHMDGGYDTKNGTIKSVIIEDEHSTPAATTVEYFLVTDSGTEIPILPMGTTTYREPALNMADSAGNISARITFEPAASTPGNVHALYWDEVSHAMVDIGNWPATNKAVTITGATPGVSYIMEYLLSTATDQFTVDVPAQVGASGWFHGEMVPEGYKIPLPATPYIDYSYYDWKDKTWLSRHPVTGEACGLNGFYSDNTILTQDISDGCWTIVASRSGIADSVDAIFYYATRSSYVISGIFQNSADDTLGYDPQYRVIFTGTGKEDNEYNYTWWVEPLGLGIPGDPLASGLVLTNSKLYYEGDPDPSPNASGGWWGWDQPGNNMKRMYTTSVYDPIEVFIDGRKATDYTNYKKEEQELLDPYQESNDYRYYMDRGSIYMNMNFDEIYNRRVSSRIRYLTSYIRLKVVLRTNMTESSYHTPLINSYTLKFLSC